MKLLNPELLKLEERVAPDFGIGGSIGIGIGVGVGGGGQGSGTRSGGSDGSNSRP
jgi:hypothetical protein